MAKVLNLKLLPLYLIASVLLAYMIHMQSSCNMDIHRGRYNNILLSYPCAIVGLLLTCTTVVYLSKSKALLTTLSYVGRNTIIFYPITAWFSPYAEGIIEDILNFPLNLVGKLSLKIVLLIVAAFVVAARNEYYRRIRND